MPAVSPLFIRPARLLLGLMLSGAVLTGCGGGGGSASSATTAQGVAADPSATEAVDASTELAALEVPAQGESTSSALAVADPRTVELSYLRNVVAADLLGYAHLEVPALDNLRGMSDGSGNFIGLRNYQGQPLTNGGVRAEVSVDYPFKEGQTIRYAWRFGITADFASDAPNNRWWLFGDWHDQPDPLKGETWDTYPHHSPSVGLGYGQINGQDNLALFYGAPNSQTIGLIPFKRGVWHQIVVDITWSRGSSGSVKVYLDGASKPVQQAKGANMYNDYQQYLKLGSYRDPAIGGDSWVYLRDVKISRIS
jgi:hypothetical protein